MDFQGKAILVTGAGRGIGAAIARAFAAEGAMVAVNYLRNKAAAEAVAAECRALGGDGLPLRADVTDAAAVEAAVDAAVETFGQLDLVDREPVAGEHAPVDDIGLGHRAAS